MDAGCARGLCCLAAAVFASSGPTVDAAPMTDSPSIAPLATPAPHGLERLHVPLLDDAGWSQARVDRWLWEFTTLGIVLRLLVYLLRLPIWTDETKLATSLLDRGYRGLAEPLVYGQIAPVPFMWIQKTATVAFGFSEYSLRLLPLLAGITSVLLMRQLAVRLCSGLLLSIGVIVRPYRDRPDLVDRNFARWLWEVKPQETVLVRA
jgi:hypothetical protein